MRRTEPGERGLHLSAGGHGWHVGPHPAAQAHLGQQGLQALKAVMSFARKTGVEMESSVQKRCVDATGHQAEEKMGQPQSFVPYLVAAVVLHHFFCA